MTNIQLGSAALYASCTEGNEAGRNEILGVFALRLSHLCFYLPLSHRPASSMAEDALKRLQFHAVLVSTREIA